MQDVNNLHSKLGYSLHTGHKQQVLKKRRQELEPQITQAQAKEIIAVTTIVQQQEQISEIVETQQRKLKQKNTLEAIKEKIKRQQQQMAARKLRQKQMLSRRPGDAVPGGVFTAASALHVIAPSKHICIALHTLTLSLTVSVSLSNGLCPMDFVQWTQPDAAG